MGQTAFQNFNQFEIVQVGIGSASASGIGANYTSAAHNLGYAPKVLADLNDVNLGSIFTGGNLPLPTFISASIEGDFIAFNSYIFVATDAFSTYFIIYNGSATPISSFDVKYYLLREKAN